jgi:hypothetical protein
MNYWNEPHREKAIKCKYFESGGICSNAKRISELNLYDSDRMCPLSLKRIKICGFWVKRKEN